MGLLLSVLITCVGVLEVIACYTQFRVGVAYSECKSNIRDIARYYAVELRKHELHFEPGPDDGGPSTSQDTLSELIRKRTVRTQEKLQPYTNGHLTSSCTGTPDQGTPNIAANLKVPRNSVCGLDSPTVQTLISPELDITEAVEKIQNLETNDWNRKSPSPYPLDNWNRSPSPFPESDSGVEMVNTTDILNKITFTNQESIEEGSEYSKTDLEVQNIMLKTDDVLFGITAETAESDETKFDEAFLRSLDGVKSSKCDDRRRSFRKKRNSSSTSSRASRDETCKSITSLDEIDDKKISPLTEEIEQTTEMNGHQIRTEVITPEKCESIASPLPDNKPKDKVFVTKQEETLFEAEVTPNKTTKESSTSDKGKANVTITEKVKDLEISVQLLVTVKGTSQGDKMEYTTTVSSDEQKSKEIQPSNAVKEEITKTTEEKSEFGNVKTSVTYGNSMVPEQPTEDIKTNIKDLQISSQSLIHAERTVLDDVASSEAEFLKLYESYTELPENQKDEFLKIISRSKSEENLSRKTEINNEMNLENPPEEDVNNVETITCDKQEEIEEQINSEKQIEFEIIQKTACNDEEIINKEIDENIQETIISKTEINEEETQANITNEINSEKQIVTEPSKIEFEIIQKTAFNDEEIINKEIDTNIQETNISKTEITELETSVNMSNESKIESTEPEPPQEVLSPPKQESSSESTSTPSTVLETATRRASKSAFEEATSVQNQEMKRRLSNTEISPKQASQAFWVKTRVWHWFQV